ncbi:hypothetical protein TPHA_0B03090 [Tetrapisispora phaffii CBS 4417]|uniref:DUF300-domain-containing protein n=1 Tax=Tetrapisispora phaffii (strain ATCC 24235 / CBS 4417 / NBRC 1672 / NRRL Y-8282 / UCD 70-5) TaxID=1071381 RepID=G8BPQ0_TETPH|nr:hypothetical protein TPHA_0B03090 [Tetrapisispora phaffii CBS 4417]CCE61981.1 hypothetical protein TPHA_0B03090 [Tetrapisispora phaffii CBS 4417]
MINDDSKVLSVIKFLCFLSSTIAITISFYDIVRHFQNYRKPLEQRLTIRILLVVPIFSLTCFISIVKPGFAHFVTDPIREVYEAFIIFTFFSLLTLILGGERKIVSELSLEHGTIKQPVFIIGNFLKPLDLSDPEDFLQVKRGILQYVWFKPLYCCSLLALETWKSIKARYLLLFLYNISVTWSLYNLALFWIYFAPNLKKFHPWSKFLCVKLIIFASYWQSVIIELLISVGIMGSSGDGPEERAHFSYICQNTVLCLEMIFFALLHVKAFSWSDYSYKILPKCARMEFMYALRDTFCAYDVKWDFKHTLLVGSNYYTYQNFDITYTDGDLMAAMSFESRNRQLHKGFRFSNDGRQRYQITDYGSILDGDPLRAAVSYGSKNASHELEEEAWDNSIGEMQYRIDDPNYPVIWEVAGHRYTNDMNTIRESLRNSNGYN